MSEAPRFTASVSRPLISFTTGASSARSCALTSSSVCSSTTSRSWRSKSEEHTSELQSQPNLVCRLLLEKTKYKRSFYLTGLVHPSPAPTHGSGHVRAVPPTLKSLLAPPAPAAAGLASVIPCATCHHRPG